MATYKEVNGTAVQNNAGDYTGAVEGQVWYNSTANSFQFRSVAASSSWATGGNLNTARSQMGGAGSGQTNALGFGGETPGGEHAQTETYNGTSWTEVNDLTAATRLQCGIGIINTAVLAAGGYQPPGYQSKVESWNGTSWTETTDTNSAKGAGGSAGTSTAGLAFAGVPGGPMATNESWNGSAWTELADLNTGRRNPGSSGVLNTAALCFGGEDPSSTAVTESWNGTSWTEVGDLNTARAELAGIGSSTLALGAGGFGPGTTYQALVELWNGTSWTETTNIPTAHREYGRGAGLSNTSGVIFGGKTPPVSAATYEWTGAGAPITETITTS
jgi:hypothetical protein